MCFFLQEVYKTHDITSHTSQILQAKSQSQHLDKDLVGHRWCRVEEERPCSDFLNPHEFISLSTWGQWTELNTQYQHIFTHPWKTSEQRPSTWFWILLENRSLSSANMNLKLSLNSVHIIEASDHKTGGIFVTLMCSDMEVFCLTVACLRLTDAPSSAGLVEPVVYSGHLDRKRSVQQLPPRPVQHTTCCCRVSGVGVLHHRKLIGLMRSTEDGWDWRWQTAEEMKCVRLVSQKQTDEERFTSKRHTSAHHVFCYFQTHTQLSSVTC